MRDAVDANTLFCMHIGWRPLRMAAALASLKHFLVSTFFSPPILHLNKHFVAFPATRVTL